MVEYVEESMEFTLGETYVFWQQVFLLQHFTILCAPWNILKISK